MVMLVAYDLNRPGQTYDAVAEQLRLANGGYCHAQGSVWLIDSTAGSAWWRNQLMAIGDANDTFFVTRLYPNDWRSANMDGAAAWLQAAARHW